MELRENDYLRQLVNYFKKNLAKGYTIDSLKFALKNQGHSMVAINQAIGFTQKELAENAPKLQPLERPKVEITEGKKGFWARLFGR